MAVSAPLVIFLSMVAVGAITGTTVGVILATRSTGSTAVPSSIEGESLDFRSYIGSYSYIAEDSDGYILPTAAELASFESVALSMIADDFTVAYAAASSISYTVRNISDSGNNGTLLYCLEPVSGADFGRGIFCVCPSASKRHHVSAPHPIKDFNTDQVAVDVFRGVSLRYYSVSTANRCANLAASPCSGTTSVCGATSQAYRTSDAAHHVDSFFDRFSRLVSDSTAAPNTLQIHGCGSTTCPSGTASDVVIRASCGDSNVLNASALSNQLYTAATPLVAVKSGATVRTCNLAGQPDYLLCASTNTQGRYINGQTTSPCLSSVSPLSLSSFLHIECNLDLRVDSGLSDLITPNTLVSALNAFLS